MLTSFYPARAIASLQFGKMGASSNTQPTKYRLPAQNVTLLRVCAGDEITIDDPEGMQSVVGAAFDINGKPLPSVLCNNHDDTLDAALNTWLSTHLTQSLSHSHLLLAPASTPNTHTFTVPQDMEIYLAAPGQDMGADQPIPPTDIYLYVNVNASDESNNTVQLPPPITDAVRKEVRVNRCTAESFTVKAGEYIQIIDIEGKQCSDFVVFDAHALNEKKEERSVCPVTTRTLMASAYPEPGLYNKYYNADMECMMEIYQDTIGRHDTFNLACSAKYYDDIGYPGHINCSDNLNGSLADYGIKPKKSWPAINFFFNTGYDDHNNVTADQPWSRAGDYVILRAQQDLICGVTACPDDTSNANGWRPTDIHVRVYHKNANIPLGIAHRNFPEADYTMTKKTAFHDCFAKLTQHFDDYNGYWLANHFSNYGAINEYWACRERVVMTDLSPLRKYEVVGPDAENLLNYVVTRNIHKLAVGQVIYTAMCYENGGMIDDGTVFRLSDNNFRWVGGCDASGQWLRQIAQDKDMDVLVKESTDQLHTLPVQGPLSRELLQQVIFTPDCQTSIANLEWFRITHGRISEPSGIPVTISRTGYTGELGYEVWCHPNHGAAVWQAIWDAGQDFGIAPMGLKALDMLRIEAGLIFAGYEFSDQTDPFEAGIAFTVPLKSKTEDFIGRDALLKRKEHPKEKLVGLVLDSNEVAEHGDCVRIGRQQVGVITSAIRSPILQQSIALCRISVKHSDIDTAVEVGKLDGHLKRIPAKIVGLSHYDPTKSRVRA